MFAVAASHIAHTKQQEAQEVLRAHAVMRKDEKATMMVCSLSLSLSLSHTHTHTLTHTHTHTDGGVFGAQACRAEGARQPFGRTRAHHLTNNGEQAARQAGGGGGIASGQGSYQDGDGDSRDGDAAAGRAR